VSTNFTAKSFGAMFHDSAPGRARQGLRHPPPGARVGGSGDYDVAWSYNVGNDGPQVNFDFVGDNCSDMNLTGPNHLGSGGSSPTSMVTPVPTS
jgi:hypothetical protein